MRSLTTEARWSVSADNHWLDARRHVLDRAKLGWIALVLACVACGDDGGSPDDADAAGRRATDSATGGGGGAVRGAEDGASGRAGAAGRRSGLSCPTPSSAPVQCGGRTCPTRTEYEENPCNVPCCVVHEGVEQCGLRGTSAAFTTECVMPAVADPTCDEIVQFQGCCEPTLKVCGIIGGFAPGCQTKSSFVTLPANPKKCGGGDAGMEDGGS